jgi:hypothetical protein
MIRWYAMTWVWAIVLAPVAAGLFIVTGLNIVICAAIVAGVLVLLLATRKRRRHLVTAPPPRALTRREIYTAYISSSAWRDKRRQRLAIDRHSCRDCGASWDLEVHHLTYDRFQHELMSDLITLCDKCHHGRHARQRRQAHR